jgi:6-phosphogluconolactonase (cycloisomerase 2 family)
VAFDPSGKLLASVNPEGHSVTVFGVAANGLLSQIGSPKPVGDNPMSGAFSPGGELFAVASSAGQSVSVFSVAASGALTPAGSPTPTVGFAELVAFSPSGRLLAVATWGVALGVPSAISVYTVSATGGLSLVGSRAQAMPSSMAFWPPPTPRATTCRCSRSRRAVP